MRMSAHENYPGPSRVYLDDVEQKDVMACDPEAGYVELALRCPKGNFFLVDDQVAIETKTGTVRIELIAAALTGDAARVEAKRALRRFF